MKKDAPPGPSTLLFAQILETDHVWSDLVLPKEVLDQLDDIVSWTKFRDEITADWGKPLVIKPGMRALFYGPPGTGKTLVAALLGKRLDVPVHRIDLSSALSKYIGETEKNIAAAFEEATTNDAILFFDEADALFGQRSDNMSSNDRYANQEVSYLLQRIENHPGLVLIASNQRDQIDATFQRRFQSVIRFCRPDAQARRQLWANALGAAGLLEGIDLNQLAQDYEVTGQDISNILWKLALKHSQNSNLDLIQLIQRELSARLA